MRVPTQRATRKSATERSVAPVFAAVSARVCAAQRALSRSLPIALIDRVDAALAASGHR